MGSLSVVDGFETNSWPHTHSGCDFKNDEFSWIFKILICGSNYSNHEIGRYQPENHDLTSEISSLMLEPEMNARENFHGLFTKHILMSQTSPD